MTLIRATHMADPACPWAYSALPAITALRWRYGSQLDWRIVTIGLAETTEQYEDRGYSPAMMARTPLRFGRFGMPYTLGPRPRLLATGRACRAVVAVRLDNEGLAYRALRALSLAWFTTDLLLDEDEAIAAALDGDPALDGAATVARLEDADVEEAYQADRAEARSAAGSPSALQDRTASTDGPERYTAPTLVFERNEQRLEAGGHQPLAAYDVLVANLDPSLTVAERPDGPLGLLQAFPEGLTTREVSTVMAAHDEPVEDAVATAALLDLVSEGLATREPFGADALWRAAGSHADAS